MSDAADMIGLFSFSNEARWYLENYMIGFCLEFAASFFTSWSRGPYSHEDGVDRSSHSDRHRFIALIRARFHRVNFAPSDPLAGECTITPVTFRKRAEICQNTPDGHLLFETCHP